MRSLLLFSFCLRASPSQFHKVTTTHYTSSYGKRYITIQTLSAWTIWYWTLGWLLQTYSLFLCQIGLKEPRHPLLFARLRWILPPNATRCIYISSKPTLKLKLHLWQHKGPISYWGKKDKVGKNSALRCIVDPVFRTLFKHISSK